MKLNRLTLAIYLLLATLGLRADTLDRDQLRASLIEHEGYQQHPYIDTANRVSIGVGRNLTDVGLSDDEIAYLLDNDIERAIRAAAAYGWFQDLDGVRKAVVVEMIFNLGPGGFAKFSRTMAAIQAGDYETAAQRMLRSRWAVQVGRRAKRLAEAMRTGVAPWVSR